LVYKRFSEVELTGSLVKLRVPALTDADPAFKLLCDVRVTSQLIWAGPESAESLADGYRTRAMWWKEGQGDYTFAIEALGKPDMIGSVSVAIGSHPQQLRMGYWLGVPFWGQGYMTDAARLASGFAFEHMSAVRIHAGVFVGNTGSRRVLEKNGFQLDGTLRCNLFKNGEWHDEWVFTLLRTDWEQNQSRYLPEKSVVVEM